MYPTDSLSVFWWKEGIISFLKLKRYMETSSALWWFGVGTQIISFMKHILKINIHGPQSLFKYLKSI